MDTYSIRELADMGFIADEDDEWHEETAESHNDSLPVD